MSDEKTPTCPYCEVKHDIGPHCKISDLWKSQTALLAKYLRTAPLERKLAEVTKERDLLQSIFDEWKADLGNPEIPALAIKDLLKERDSLKAFKERAVECIGKAADRLGRCHCSNDKDWAFARAFLEREKEG